MMAQRWWKLLVSDKSGLMNTDDKARYIILNRPDISAVECCNRACVFPCVTRMDFSINDPTAYVISQSQFFRIGNAKLRQELNFGTQYLEKYIYHIYCIFF